MSRGFCETACPERSRRMGFHAPVPSGDLTTTICVEAGDSPAQSSASSPRIPQILDGAALPALRFK